MRQKHFFIKADLYHFPLTWSVKKDQMREEGQQDGNHEIHLDSFFIFFFQKGNGYESLSGMKAICFVVTCNKTWFYIIVKHFHFHILFFMIFVSRYHIPAEKSDLWYDVNHFVCNKYFMIPFDISLSISLRWAYITIQANVF